MYYFGIMKRYIIIKSSTLEGLEKQVNDVFLGGWDIVGSHVVIIDKVVNINDGSGVTKRSEYEYIYTQTMINNS